MQVFYTGERLCKTLNPTHPGREVIHAIRGLKKLLYLNEAGEHGPAWPPGAQQSQELNNTHLASMERFPAIVRGNHFKGGSENF